MQFQLVHNRQFSFLFISGENTRVVWNFVVFSFILQIEQDAIFTDYWRNYSFEKVMICFGDSQSKKLCNRWFQLLKQCLQLTFPIQ